MRLRNRGLAVAAVAALALTLGACSDSGSDAPSGSGTSSGAHSGLSATDAWVKAADSGMTAAFGTLTNNGSTDVTVVGATSDLSPVEIHEMAMADGKMVMRQKEGGVKVPAGGSVTFEPGGEHLMLMDLSAPVKAGGEYPITLELSDGSTLKMMAAGRTYSGAKEDYQGDSGTETSGSMESSGSMETSGATETEGPAASSTSHG